MIKKAVTYTSYLYDWLNNYGATFVELYCRVYVALIFWKSGSLALQDVEATLYLYQYEFHVPYLHHTVAAILGISIEIVASVLLAAGLAGRLAALSLFISSVIIQISDQAMEAHMLQMLVLALIIVRGPGKFSIDYFLQKRFFQNNSSNFN